MKSKVIVIMGGTGGLGLSAARAFVSRGARVMIVGRDAYDAAIAIGKLGEHNAANYAGDAADPVTAHRAIALAIERFGRIDGLYHVAGGSGRSKGDGPLHEIADEGIDYTIDLNLKSVLYSNRAAVRQFLRQGDGGAVLNMTTVLAFSPSSTQPASLQRAPPS